MPASLPSAEDALVDALRRRLSRSGRRAVVVRETHLSWILLAGNLALKLKKPVRLPFVDFSQAQTRRRACDEELRLNRRLAPSLYRRVLGVRGSRAAPRFQGTDEEIDAIVCMRRFPEGSLLDERLAAGRLEPIHIDRLAERMARFHAAAEPANGVGDAAEEAARPVARVLAQLVPYQSAEWNDAAGRWLEASRARLAPVWRRRQADGAVRDGHGDLHLANAVALPNGDVTAFDCIEFDPALRRIDVISDIAFLTMDLSVHGRPDLAHRFLDGWLAACGDYAGLVVLDFYETARACVRGLVQQLGPRPSGGAIPDYLGFAASRMARAPARPRLAVLHGLSGSGKSTLAMRLVEATGAVRVRSDVERKRLFGLSATARPRDAHALYDEDTNRRTYRRLAECVRTVVSAGFDAIVDAACLQREQRQVFEQLAAELGVPFTLIACEVPLEELQRRVAERAREDHDASDADLAVLERQLGSLQPLTPAERAHAILVDEKLSQELAVIVARWQADRGGSGSGGSAGITT